MLFIGSRPPGYTLPVPYMLSIIASPFSRNWRGRKSGGGQQSSRSLLPMNNVMAVAITVSWLDRNKSGLAGLEDIDAGRVGKYIDTLPAA